MSATLAILRREPILHRIPLAVLVAVLFTALASVPFELLVEPAPQGPRGIVGYGPMGIGGGPEPIPSERHARLAFGFVLWMTVNTIFITAMGKFPFAVRVFEHEQALPLRTERVWFERLGALWVALCTAALAASATYALRVPEARWVFQEVTLGVVLACTFAVLLVASYRPTRPRLIGSEVPLVWGAAGAVSALVGIVSLTKPALALGVTVVVGAWAAMPLVQRRPVAPRSIRGSRQGSRVDDWGVSLFGATRWVLLRSATMQGWFLLFVVLAAVWCVAGPYLSSAGFLHIYVILALSRAVFTGLRRSSLIRSLPVAPGRVLRVVGSAPLAVLVVAFVASGVMRSAPDKSGLLATEVGLGQVSEETLTQELASTHQVLVPAVHWRLALRPDVVRVVAPWGEAFDPTPHPLLPLVSVCAYNPYDSGPRSTLRFVTWQLCRAVQDVHGVALEVEELHEAWFPGQDLDAPVEELWLPSWSFSEAGRGSHMDPAGDSVRTALAAGHDGSGAATNGFAVLGALVIWFLGCLAALTYLAGLADGHGFRMGANRRRLRVSLSVTLLALLVPIGMDLLTAGDRVLVPILLSSLARWLDALLLGSWALWGVFLVGVYGGCERVLTAQLRRLEVSSSSWTRTARRLQSRARSGA